MKSFHMRSPQVPLDLWLLIICMRQQKKIILIYLILTASTNSNWAMKPTDYLTLTLGNFIVLHTPADSSYAVKATTILQQSFDEISWDFQITRRDTFQVIIVPTRKEFQQIIFNKLPAWTEAFASPALKRMIIKSPRWAMQESFAVDLTHELLHLVVFQNSDGRPIPRWLDEGLAIFYSKEPRWQTATALSKAILTHSLIPLDSIDQVLTFQRIKAELAYQESYSATHYILRNYDIEAIRTILTGIRHNQNMNDIFLKATGSTYPNFEQEWLRYITKHYKWYWLTDLDDFIWIFLLVLFMIAFVFIRHRNKRIMQIWQQEAEQETEQDFSNE